MKEYIERIVQEFIKRHDIIYVTEGIYLVTKKKT